MAFTSEWQIRCLTCGRTRDAAEAGIIRKVAYGRKYTLGWCRSCRWLRCAVIEPKRAETPASQRPTAG